MNPHPPRVIKELALIPREGNPEDRASSEPRWLRVAVEEVDVSDGLRQRKARYVSTRVWHANGMTGELRPTRGGHTVRLAELDRYIAALVEAKRLLVSSRHEVVSRRQQPTVDANFSLDDF